MADIHEKSFFGQKSAVILKSPAKETPYIFLQCIKRKDDGAWEKETEGKTVKLFLEELICILEVLKRRGLNWRGYHVFKNERTEIFVGWESDDLNILLIKVGNYNKKLKFPNTNFLTLLLEHILNEKIAFATSGKFESKDSKDENEEIKESDYIVFSENITAKLGLKVVETTEYDLNKNAIEIKAKIKVESPKALLITLDTGNEFWIPKSTVYNNFDVKDKNNYQKLIVEKWIIDKNIYQIFEKED